MSNSTRTISGFEKFQFAVTRILAILVALFAWVIIIGVAIYFFQKVQAGTHVDASEIMKSSATSGNASVPAMGQSSTYRMPDNLKAFFTGDNKAVLDGWLQGLTVQQQQDFLDNLSQIANTPNGVPADAVNAYKDIKLKRLIASGMDRYEQIGEIAGGVAAVVAALFLVILTSLVLVLLAIERNTRLQPIALKEVVT